MDFLQNFHSGFPHESILCLSLSRFWVVWCFFPLSICSSDDLFKLFADCSQNNRPGICKGSGSRKFMHFICWNIAISGKTFLVSPALRQGSCGVALPRAETSKNGDPGDLCQGCPLSGSHSWMQLCLCRNARKHHSQSVFLWSFLGSRTLWEQILLSYCWLLELWDNGVWMHCRI